jgi:hypothetical protein
MDGTDRGLLQCTIVPLREREDLPKHPIFPVRTMRNEFPLRGIRANPNLTSTTNSCQCAIHRMVSPRFILCCRSFCLSYLHFLYLCRSQWPRCLRLGLLEQWDCGFESRLRHGCMSAFLWVVVSCIGTGLEMGRTSVQESYQDDEKDSQFQK